MAWACGAWMAVVGAAGPAEDMKAFPAPDPGMRRHVLDLPARKDESGFKVELIVGRVIKTDAANRFFFGGKIEEETIQGWGFPRYVVRDLGPLAGTRMALDAGAPPVDRFVALGGEPCLLRYNSQLPLVVYVPENAEVRYRVWRAEGKPQPVPAR